MIYIKQLLIKRSMLFTFGFLLSFVSLGFSQNIDGVSSVNSSTTHKYTFDNAQLNGGSWNVTNGTVISTTQPSQGSDNTVYSAIVEWGTTGSATLNFNSFGNTLATLNITIVSAGSYTTLLSDLNYVHTIVPRKASTNVAQLASSDKIENVTYFDGLGRANQSVRIRAGGKKQDILSHIEYDDYSRQEKEFLPVAVDYNGGAFSHLALPKTNTFYNTTKYENTTNPFSEKAMEASPLSRVFKQAAPGFDWRMDGGHEIEMGYLTNSTNEVRHYKVNLSFANNTYTPTLVLSGYYNPGELYKSIIKDENHDGSTTKAHTTEEFKDVEGRVVLKRTYGTSNVNGVEQVNVAHDTYYVYNNYGNLTYVLPPKSEPQQAKPDATELSELCYQYKYDHRNRLVEKKIPGKGWESIVYNKLDQPIMTQDANLKAQGKWLVTKYDTYNRIAYTAIKNSTSTRINLQNTFDADPIGTPQFESRASNTGYLNTYYTSVARPTLVDNILTISYYDDYKFDLDGGVSENAFGVTPITYVKSLATGSKVRVLDTDKWITNVIYYDAKARPIYNYGKNNYLETIDKLYSQLEFDGTIKETLTLHEKTGNNDIKIADKFTYDTVNRLKAHTQSVDGGATEVIVENAYDELGQLINKGVGGKVNEKRLQYVDFTYNVRGWLETINDLNKLGNDLFAFEINYNEDIEGTGGGSSLYNGNISQVIWNTANSSSKRGYSFDYDALNRLKTSYSRKGNSLNTADEYSMWTKYDKNGNITALYRNGHVVANPTEGQNANYGTMDNLSYSYETKSNKLKKVLDNGNDNYGFRDGVNATTEYIYDANGNMIVDHNKGISNIDYNHLNLPTKVSLAAGDIDYVYDATGVKLKKTVTKGAVTKYAGLFIYEDDKLKFFSQPEGYVEPGQITRKGPTYDYVYQYKDHLGNIRVSYEDSNDNGSIDGTSEIREENNYYPFGLQHKGYNNVVNGTDHNYGFGGKEEQDEFGLGWIDVTARNYSPELGRWMNLDPLAEDMTRHSPYNFAFNNPIYFQDYDGMAPTASDCEDCPNSITYSYQKNSKTQDRHTLTTVETTTKKDSFSKDGNTKTTSSYTVTTTDTITRDKENGTSRSTMQSVDMNTETFSKDSEGNWVSNGDSSTSNIAQNNNGLVHKEGATNGNVKTTNSGITHDGNFISTMRSYDNELISDRVNSYLEDSNVGDNLIDDESAFNYVRKGTKIAAWGTVALSFVTKLPSKLVRKAGFVGAIVTGYDLINEHTKSPVKSKVLREY